MNATAQYVWLAACSLSLLGGCGEVEGSGPTSVEVSDANARASIDVIDHTGFLKLLEQRDGKPALINFWAMWCQPCVTELPDFLAAADALRARGGEVHTIAMDLLERGTTAEHVHQALPGFLSARGFDMPVSIYDDDSDQLAKLGIPGVLPSTIVVNSVGQIIEVHEGAASRAEFDAMVARALAPAVPAAK